MKEDFLQYVWQYGLFDKQKLCTSKGLEIQVIKLGSLNTNAGPDFFNAHLRIADYLWVGNVEIHVNASDWFLHNHDSDDNYKNVILHVVWNNDTAVHINHQEIPTLELRNFISNELLSNYDNFFKSKKSWIICESNIQLVPTFILEHWKERLFFERIDHKASSVKGLLESLQNDWEVTLFVLLAKGFGLKQNSDAFEAMARSFNFSIVRKTGSNVKVLEALFFGMSHLLTTPLNDEYLKVLKADFEYLKRKFDLEPSLLASPTFFRMRPAGFPTIRLSQLAVLYAKSKNLFEALMNAESVNAIERILKVTASSYWNRHYNFGVNSTERKKTLTNSFIQLLIINSIVPLKFVYLKEQGRSLDTLLPLVQALPSEKNNIINSFNELKILSNSAFDSQALLQLKNIYCAPQKCLQCAIGHYLLKS